MSMLRKHGRGLCGVPLFILIAVSGCNCNDRIRLLSVEEDPKEQPNLGTISWDGGSVPTAVTGGATNIPLSDATLGGCIDNDGDGYGEGYQCKGPDCDDSDPDLGQNGLRTCYTGASGTLDVGVCHSGVQICTNGVLGACENEVVPTPEVCDNVDNDCDGEVDQQVTRSCYSGPEGTLNVGLCAAGTQTCSAGVFGECVGDVTPQTELCDNQDNNCDGQVDEQVSRNCYDGPPGTQNKGSCSQGVQFCSAGVFGSCIGEVLPAPEVCDNVDNNCDGTVDEQLSRACYTGPAGTENVGVCVGGVQTCSAGVYGACIGQRVPSGEICDNKDNDCNGLVDENVTRSCYDGAAGTKNVGLCHSGTQVCTAGVFGSCDNEVTPVTESCDNLDNDCDGKIDDGVTQSCYTGPAGTEGVGVCVHGTATCTAGTFGACVGEKTPSAELCDNKDNNCNGQVDEAVTRSCYTGPAGTSGVGLCASGTQSCSAGVFGACNNQVLPAAEICDNKDNDCDGAVDDGVVRACYDGPAGTSGVGVCRAGTQSCSAGVFGACNGETLPSAERCDSLDDNCNGQTDENVTRYSQSGTTQTVVASSDPVDIIFVIDNSGSMSEEILAVQANINNNFAAIMDRAGVDYRVIMLSQHGDVAQSSHAICISSPLSGNGNCVPPISTCPVNGPRFFHYSVGIDSHSSPSQVLSTYNQRDACGLAPRGWQEWLRPGAKRAFIEITDDGPNTGTGYNGMDADTFERGLFALRPAYFGSATARNYTFHTIAGLHENNPRLTPWPPTAPLVDTRCTGNGGHVVQPGTEYQKLSTRSGGLRYPICEYTSFDAVFSGLAGSIITSVRTKCDFTVASVPPDSSLANTYLEFIPSGGGATTTLTHVSGASACTANAFYTSSNGTITLCPQACTLWQTDPQARVDVLFTCSSQVQ